MKTLSWNQKIYDLGKLILANWMAIQDAEDNGYTFTAVVHDLKLNRWRSYELEPPRR